MDIGIISNRYAKALYAYASAEHAEDEVYREMAQLADSYIHVHELRTAMDNPMLTDEDKAQLLCAAAVAGKGATKPAEAGKPGSASEAKAGKSELASVEVSKPFAHFVQLVLNQHREMFMQFMASSYIDLYRKEKHISIGSLTTAVPVSPQVAERLKAMVKAGSQGEVEFLQHVDDSLVGGFVLDVDGNRIDASVATQLKNIRREYAQKNMKIV